MWLLYRKHADVLADKGEIFVLGFIVRYLPVFSSSAVKTPSLICFEGLICWTITYTQNFLEIVFADPAFCFISAACLLKWLSIYKFQKKILVSLITGKSPKVFANVKSVFFTIDAATIVFTIVFTSFIIRWICLRPSPSFLFWRCVYAFQKNFIFFDDTLC